MSNAKFTKGKWESEVRKVDGNIFEVIIYLPGGRFFNN